MFCVAIVTVFNLFYKQRFSEKIHAMNAFYTSTHPIARSLCPLQGFRCPSNEPCDCEEICSNGSHFIKFQVMDRDAPIFVMDRQLTPGTYCLPRGVDRCHHDTTVPVFSLAGWNCLPLNASVFQEDFTIACKSAEARHNERNVLWDYKKNSEAAAGGDDYERFQGGYRYRCRCGSESLDGTRMVSPLPFVCVVDHCLRDMSHPAPFMGWDGSKCECGVYDHADPDDPTSPCRTVVSKVDHGLLTGRVDGMTRDSFVPRVSLYNPSDERVMRFRVAAEAPMPTRDYMDRILDVYRADRNPQVEAFYISRPEEDP